MHVSAVASWLARIECGETCLACGAQSPRNAAAAQALLIEGRAPTRLHNNCSGKHAGFLTLARHLGLDPVGYERPDHPVQRLVLATIAEMAQTDLALMPVAIDGCAAPAPALPLRALAAAIARLAQPSGLAQPRAAAARRLDAAVKAHPMMVAGAGRACTQMIRAGAGAFTVKTGAEGVYVAALSTLGLGVALKIDDGATRAAETTIAALLVGLGLVVAEDPAIAALLDAPVLDTQDRIVGSRRPAAWLAAAARDAVAGRSK
jgi:L-asparaginase II